MTGAPRQTIPGGYRKVPNRLAFSTLTDGAIRTYLWLQRYAKEGLAFPSRETLRKDMDCSLRTVDRRLDELVKAGWITPTTRKKTYKGVIAYKVNTSIEDAQKLPRRTNPGQFSRSNQPDRPDRSTDTHGGTQVATGDASPLCATGDGEVITSNDSGVSQDNAVAVCPLGRCEGDGFDPSTNAVCECWSLRDKRRTA